MKPKLPGFKARELPTREELDKQHPRRHAVLALGIFGTLVTLAASWWSRHGSDLLTETVYKLETLHLYWMHVATPEERTIWTWLIIGLVLFFILALILIHRFVWRALFPDLVRLDPVAHPGGKPERVGRLYRVRKYRDGDKIRYRHAYKHGNRWMPIFRFDHVDLDQPAEPTVFGVSMIRCGRLERDPHGNRFKRIPNAEGFEAHPLATSFREKELVEDQDRKASIVMPGPGMNPEVMRKKWRDEAMINPWPEKRARQALDTATTPPEES